MFYILEGADGAGKTTLAKSLQKMHGGEIVHFGAPANEQEERDYWKVYVDAILKNAHKKVVIFDRSWYSDFIYGPVIRKRDTMSVEMMSMLENSIKLNGGGLIIYVRAPLNTMWKRCQTRGEKLVTSKEILKKISDGYDAVFNSQLRHPWGLPVLTYKSTLQYDCVR